MAKIPQLYPMAGNHLVRSHDADPNGGGWYRTWCAKPGGEPPRGSVEFKPLPDDEEEICQHCIVDLRAFLKE